MSMRVICVKAPRGLRGILRMFARKRKEDTSPRRGSLNE